MRRITSSSDGKLNSADFSARETSFEDVLRRKAHHELKMWLSQEERCLPSSDGVSDLLSHESNPLSLFPTDSLGV